MSDLRDAVARAISDDPAWAQNYDDGQDRYFDIADAILAVIREALPEIRATSGATVAGYNIALRQVYTLLGGSDG